MAPAMAEKPAPGADGLAAPVLGKGSADDRQRTGNEQRRAHALHGPRRDQMRDVARQATGERCQSEDHDARDEHTAAAQAIAGRPAHQQEGREAERVGVDTHCSVAAEVARPAIAGSATLTTDSSIEAMTEARIVAASTQFCWLTVHAVTPRVARIDLLLARPRSGVGHTQALPLNKRKKRERVKLRSWIAVVSHGWKPRMPRERASARPIQTNDPGCCYGVFIRSPASSEQDSSR